MDKCKDVKSERDFCSSIKFISDGQTTEPTCFDGGKFWYGKKQSRLSISNTTAPFWQANVLRGLRISKSTIFNNGSMKWSVWGGRFSSVEKNPPSYVVDSSTVTNSRQL